MSVHLKEILDAKALTPQPANDGIRLRETDVMEVEVVNPPPDLTAVAMEKLGRLSGMKDGEWTQVCDYLLVYPQAAAGVPPGVFPWKKPAPSGRRNWAGPWPW